MKIVAFSGFSLNGKTYIIRILKKILPNVIVLEESARLAAETQNFDEKSFEERILMLEKDRLEILNQLRQMDCDAIILQDRHILDALAFQFARGLITIEQGRRRLEDLLRRMKGGYQAVILFEPIKDKGIVEYAYKNDKVRQKAVPDFWGMQERFYQGWRAMAKDIVKYASLPSPSEYRKMDLLMAILEFIEKGVY